MSTISARSDLGAESAKRLLAEPVDVITATSRYRAAANALPQQAAPA